MSAQCDWLTYSQVLNIVSALFAKAEGEMGLRPEQSYAYVQDETESLQGVNSPVGTIFVQTAIYSELIRRGVLLCRDDLYVTEMLDALSLAYNNFNEIFFDKLGMDEAEKCKLIYDMNAVKSEILGWKAEGQ